MKSSSRQRRIRSLKAKAAMADSAEEFDNYGSEPNMKLSHAFMVVLALHVIAVGGLFAFNKVKSGHSKASEKLQNQVLEAQEAVASEEAKPLVPAPVREIAKEVKKEILPQSSQHVSEAANSTSNLNNSTAQTVASKKVPPQSSQRSQEAGNPPAAATSPTTLTAAQKQFLATKTTTTSITAAPIASSAAVAAVANIASSTPVAATPVSEPVPVEAVASTEYTIIKGDNPYKIAKRFHVSYDQLIKFNNISDPRKMQIGQKIRIPNKVSKAAAQN